MPRSTARALHRELQRGHSARHREHLRAREVTGKGIGPHERSRGRRRRAHHQRQNHAQHHEDCQPGGKPAGSRPERAPHPSCPRQTAAPKPLSAHSPQHQASVAPHRKPSSASSRRESLPSFVYGANAEAERDELSTESRRITRGDIQGRLGVGQRQMGDRISPRLGESPAPRGGSAEGDGLDACLRMKATKYVVNSRSLSRRRGIWRIARVCGHCCAPRARRSGAPAPRPPGQTARRGGGSQAARPPATPTAPRAPQKPATTAWLTTTDALPATRGAPPASPTDRTRPDT